MRVTREVVTDLWPVYESGEASPDTRALVEEFLAEDAEFARLIRSPREAPLPSAPALPPDHEKQALATTQRRLRRGQWLLGFALFFTLLPGANVYTKTTRWALWQDWPAAALSSLVVAALLWAGYLSNRRRLQIQGF
jgi:hypothetical protein